MQLFLPITLPLIFTTRSAEARVDPKVGLMFQEFIPETKGRDVPLRFTDDALELTGNENLEKIDRSMKRPSVTGGGVRRYLTESGAEKFRAKAMEKERKKAEEAEKKSEEAEKNSEEARKKAVIAEAKKTRSKFVAGLRAKGYNETVISDVTGISPEELSRI